MSYPLFSNDEYTQIEGIILDCVFDFPDEVKISGDCIYLCAGWSIYDSISGCNERILNEVIHRNEILLKKCEVLLKLIDYYPTK